MGKLLDAQSIKLDIMRREAIDKAFENRHKTQAYDLSPKTKEAIQKICEQEQRSESFIVSRILNKMFDPLEIKKP